MAAVIVGLDSVIAWGNYPFQIDRLDWHTNGRLWVEMNSQLSCTDTGHHIASIAVPPSRLCSLFKRPSFCSALSLFFSSHPRHACRHRIAVVCFHSLLCVAGLHRRSAVTRHSASSDDRLCL